LSYVLESNAVVSEAPLVAPSGLEGGSAGVGPRSPWLGSMGVQLPGAVAAAVAPQFYYSWDPYTSNSLLGMLDAYSGSVASVVLGYYVLKRVTNFPTTHEAAAVLPTFTGSFVLVLALLGFLGWRFDYWPMFVGYVLSVTFLTAVLYLVRRVRKRQYALLPIGDTLSLMSQPGPQWKVLTSTPAVPSPCDGVVVDLRADIPAHWEQFLTSCVLAGVPVFHVIQAREMLTGRLDIRHLSENMLTSHDPHHAYLALKRVLDTLAALAALIVLAPLLIVVALLVRLDSPGSALFTQQRIRKGGSKFTIYKFRTMTNGAAAPQSRADAMTRDHDPRITRLGAFLRKSRIDELPQIINILKGEMSWIGPRPEAAPLAEWYESQLPFYQYRHIVPPGITGWAQVNQGHVTDPSDVLDKLHYDFFYIKNFSIWLDMLIVLKTLRTMLTGFGAR
jgi:lipopolysaccharide/colanic/teichoic acid biosynthesis glycosyltransferase